MTRAPATFRQSDITKAIRAARKAGVENVRVEIAKDGKPVGEFGSNRSRPGTVAAAVAGLERLCQSGGEHAQGQAPDSGALPRPQRR